MNIYQKGKSKYITSKLDGEDYNITTGHFTRHLQKYNLTPEQYYIKYEHLIPALCKSCGKPTSFKGFKGFEPNWSISCNDKKCVKDLLGRPGRNRTEETTSRQISTRKKTFAENPEMFKKICANNRLANMKVGKDGLSGYQKSAIGRAKTLTEKYGRPDYANWEKSKQTWADKSEEEHVIHGKHVSSGWAALSEEARSCASEKRKRTNIEKYGMICPGNLNKFSGYSKIAASLFFKLDLNGECMFKPKSREFNVNGRIFDFRYKSKLIEFNGDYWHANPRKYNGDALIGRVKNKQRTGKQIWEADALKIKIAEDAGYEVKVIWESDYRKNPKKVIEECIKWIKQ